MKNRITFPFYFEVVQPSCEPFDQQFINIYDVLPSSFSINSSWSHRPSCVSWKISRNGLVDTLFIWGSDKPSFIKPYSKNVYKSDIDFHYIRPSLSVQLNYLVSRFTCLRRKKTLEYSNLDWNHAGVIEDSLERKESTGHGKRYRTIDYRKKILQSG